VGYKPVANKTGRRRADGTVAGFTDKDENDVASLGLAVAIEN